jgi:hypothetical protein
LSILGIHCCSGGRDRSKGFARLVAHIMRLCLCDNKQKSIIHEAIESGLGLFLAVEESLRVLGQWLCGKCINICALSRACHHLGDLIRVIFTTGEIESNILVISTINKGPRYSCC